MPRPLIPLMSFIFSLYLNSCQIARPSPSEVYAESACKNGDLAFVKTPDGVNLRDEQGNKIAFLTYGTKGIKVINSNAHPADTKLYKFSDQANWYQVSVNGQTGFAAPNNSAWISCGTPDIPAAVPGTCPGNGNVAGFNLTFKKPTEDFEYLRKVYDEGFDGHGKGSKVDVKVTANINGKPVTGEISIRGGTTAGLDKKSYKLSLDDKIKFSFFNAGNPIVTEISKLNFLASYNETSFMRNAISFDSIRAMGGDAPYTGYAQICVNGEFWGFYQVVEHTGGSFKTRLGMDKYSPTYKSKDHRNWDPSGDAYVANSHGSSGTAFEDETKEGGPDVNDALDKLEASLKAQGLSKDEIKAQVKALEKQIEADRAAQRKDGLMKFFRDYNNDPNTIRYEDMSRYIAANTFFSNYDAFSKNFIFINADFRHWRILPWDMDATMGNNWDGGDKLQEAIHKDDYIGQDNFNTMKKWVDKNRCRYLPEYQGWVNNVLSAGTLIAKKESIKTVIRDHALKDLAKWPRGRGFDDEMNRIDEFFRQRHAPPPAQNVVNKIRGERC